MLWTNRHFNAFLVLIVPFAVTVIYQNRRAAKSPDSSGWPEAVENLDNAFLETARIWFYFFPINLTQNCSSTFDEIMLSFLNSRVTDSQCISIFSSM